MIYCETQVPISKCLSLVANWGLPLAAIQDMKKDAEIISPKMTGGKARHKDKIKSIVWNKRVLTFNTYV